MANRFCGGYLPAGVGLDESVGAEVHIGLSEVMTDRRMGALRVKQAVAPIVSKSPIILSSGDSCDRQQTVGREHDSP
jgi:hypothetical protein